ISTRREEMKKPTCILTSLAMVITMYLPAHAAFTGTLRGDQDWVLFVSNNANNPTGVTVYFLDRGVDVELLDTVPPRASLVRTISNAPSRVRLIVIEVDPGFTGSFPGSAQIIITQGSTTYSAECPFVQGADHCRMLLDVV